MQQAAPYNTPLWKQVRLAVLTRDQYQCQLKLPRCRGRATECDHIVDWQDGGHPYHPHNLRAACKACNVAQRNQRLAQRARQQRTQSRPW